jgi:serine O-acetyltransferase
VSRHAERIGVRALLRRDVARYRQLSGKQAGWRFRYWLALLGPRLMPNLLLRAAWGMKQRGLSRAARCPSLLAYFLFGIEATPECDIGPGLFLPHTQGTVIGAKRIGDNCTIYQGVTLGARDLDMDFESVRRPDVGDDVIIGSGAKIIGPITIGDGARIGSNANVTESVPPRHLVLAPRPEVRPRS